MMRTNGNHVGRRRGRRKMGPPSSSGIVLDQRSVLVLLAAVAAIFSLGLIAGSRALGTPSPGAAAGGASPPEAGGAGPSDHASPLVAAAGRVAPADIQRLILESAAAERIEREEAEMEAEALRRGDARAAAHLRGALAPGDANYNPHHSIDDVVDAVEGGGDGGMYASDAGMGVGGGGPGEEPIPREDPAEGMHGHFVDAIKSELSRVKEKEEEIKGRVVEGMHHQFERAIEEERKISGAVRDTVHRIEERAGLRGGEGAGGAAEGGGDGAASGGVPNYGAGGSHYPYMVSDVPSDYDFSRYEPLGGGRFAEYKDGSAPYEVTPSLTKQSDDLARSRRVHVKRAMEHIWRNYKEYAFGKDELHPISHRATSNWGGMGTTLVDSLDTLWLMGMRTEFDEAREWVADKLSNANVGQVSGFETTIRSLGGLLAAHSLSGDKVFLEKADDLGARLIRAYDTPSGLPHGSVNLSTGHSNNFSWNGNHYILAEVGTQQVEYRYLSRATGKPDYARKSEKVFEILHKIQPGDGLMMQNLGDAGPGKAVFSGSKVSFGAMGDSVYEYMLKVWVQGGRTEPMYREMWDKAIDGVHDQLVQKSTPSGMTFLADRLTGSRIDRKMDHLVCFMGGALALGAYTDPGGVDSERARRDLRTARALTYTCYQMYARQKTGIAPEYVRFGTNDMSVPGDAPFYILRPETVESFYYLSVLTGDPIYREWGWEVFQSIEKYCRTKYGYGSLKNVNLPNSVEDRMESFFMAETLKYLYLLFDPDSEIDILHKHVFNTEAHPVKILSDVATV